MKQANFDRIARPYRWLEYVALGRTLERCRLRFLPQLLGCRRALILGDGDGRFTSRLVAANHEIEADVIDISAAMLGLLRRRSETVPDAARRLRTHQGGALDFPYAEVERRYDLVVTHFFLDCLKQEELDELVSRVVPALAPGAFWVVSDFGVPSGVMRLPARAYIRGLYFAFRVLTGLRTTRLPDHSASLLACGFVSRAQHRSLGGILTAELWQPKSFER